MESGALDAVLVDALVEPGATAGEFAGALQASGSLLGSPVHPEHLADAVPEGRMELAGAGSGLSAALFGAGPWQ